MERHPDVPVAGRRRIRWSNAGHVRPLLLAPDGTSRVLETPPDLMLGVDPTALRRDHMVELDDGHTLLLVTDGLVERRGCDLDEGMARLQETPRDGGGKLLDELLARLVPRAGQDDVAVVAVLALSPGPAAAGPNRLPPGID